MDVKPSRERKKPRQRRDETNTKKNRLEKDQLTRSLYWFMVLFIAQHTTVTIKARPPPNLRKYYQWFDFTLGEGSAVFDVELAPDETTRKEANANKIREKQRFELLMALCQLKDIIRFDIRHWGGYESTKTACPLISNMEVLYQGSVFRFDLSTEIQSNPRREQFRAFGEKVTSKLTELYNAPESVPEHLKFMVRKERKEIVLNRQSCQWAFGPFFEQFFDGDYFNRPLVSSQFSIEPLNYDRFSERVAQEVENNLSTLAVILSIPFADLSRTHALLSVKTKRPARGDDTFLHDKEPSLGVVFPTVPSVSNSCIKQTPPKYEPMDDEQDVDAKDIPPFSEKSAEAVFNQFTFAYDFNNEGLTSFFTPT